MKAAALLCLAICFAGCQSIPRRCLGEAAMAASVAAAGGYLVAHQSANRERTFTPYVTPQGDIHQIEGVRRTGTLYKNRAALSIGTGLAAGAIATAICAR